MKRTHPPFHRSGSPGSHFYAIGFVPGTYVSPSQKDNIEGFLTLYFSRSKGFTRFSYHTVAPKGDLIAYTSGVDNLENAVLWAWEDYHIPPHRWKLFPGKAINQTKFESFKARKEYEKIREVFASLLHGSRMHAWFEYSEDLKSMFKIPDEPPSNPMEDTPENRERGKLVQDHILGRKAGRRRKSK